MLVSADRVFAVKYAYLYKDSIIKSLYINLIIGIWILVSVVDVIPFFPLDQPADKEQCTYVIGHMWGICVTIAFNIIPFLITIVNFGIIWRIASDITVRAYSMKKTLLLPKIEVEEASEGVEKAYSAKNTALPKIEVEEPRDGGETFSMMKTLLPKVEGSSGGSLYKEPTPFRKMVDVEVSQQCLDVNGKSVVKRKISYMYAMRDSQDYNLNNIPEVDIELDESTPVGFTEDERECTTCYQLNERLRLILEMRATKTSALLLLVYMICWTPLGVYQFVENICSSWISGIKHDHAYIDQFVLKVLSLMSSLFLPLVYCWKTKLFRNEARKLSVRIRARVKEIVP